jgi:hypothetical protein
MDRRPRISDWTRGPWEPCTVCGRSTPAHTALGAMHLACSSLRTTLTKRERANAERKYGTDLQAHALEALDRRVKSQDVGGFNRVWTPWGTPRDIPNRHDLARFAHQKTLGMSLALRYAFAKWAAGRTRPPFRRPDLT